MSDEAEEELDSANVLVPGNADIDFSLSPRENLDWPWSLPEGFLQRPVRDRRPKTHESATFAFTHRWHGAPESASKDGTHRNF